MGNHFSTEPMPGDTQLNRLYRSGSFTLDPVAGQLFKDGRKLRLAGQALDVLALLMQRPGVVVTREEIQRRLWSEETFVEFENNLNKLISKIRESLNDTSGAPKYIETLPRRGYRFIAPVTVEELRLASSPITPAEPVAAPFPNALPESDQHLAATAPQANLHSRRLRIRTLLAAAFFLLAFSLLAFRYWPIPAPSVRKIAPLTYSARADRYGRLDSDGVRLFFVQRHGHHWELSQMTSAGDSVEPFPTPFPNARIFGISPDASQFLVGPFDSRQLSLPLWIMPSIGGTPRRIGDTSVSDAIFTPDGSHITFATDDGLFLIGRDGLNLRTLADIRGEKTGLAWSPDGRELRFSWQTNPNQGIRIWSIRSDGQALHPLFPGWNEVLAECCGRFSRDGKYFVFVGYPSTDTSLLYIRAESGNPLRSAQLPTRLRTDPIHLSEPVFSSRSDHLFALGSESRVEYLAFDPASKAARSLIAAAPAAWLNVSRDMRQVSYFGASGNLWISDLDGSHPHVIADSSMHPELPAFRPRARELVFVALPPGSTVRRICAVSSDGGNLRDVVVHPTSVHAPSWSPDGTQLLFAVDPEDSPDAGLFLMDWDSRIVRKLPGSEGYWKSRWSPDGKFIAAVDFHNKFIGLFDTSKQTWTRLLDGNVFSPVAWSADSRYLYYQDLIEEEQPVHRYDLLSHHSDITLSCKSFLESGVLRCGFEDLLPDGSVLLQLTRADQNVYSIELDLH